MIEYINNSKRADHNKANAPGRREEEDRIWVHYTYYYYPNIEVYLQVETGIWFYMEGSQWKAVQVLPGKLRQMQMQNTYKVKLHYTGCNPTLLHHMNKAKYTARPKCKGKKHSMMKEKKSTKTRGVYIPVNRSDLVAFEINTIEMNFNQN